MAEWPFVGDTVWIVRADEEQPGAYCKVIDADADSIKLRPNRSDLAYYEGWFDRDLVRCGLIRRSNRRATRKHPRG